MIRDLVSVAVSMVGRPSSRKRCRGGGAPGGGVSPDLLLPGVRKGQRGPGTDEPGQPAELEPVETPAAESSTDVTAAERASGGAARSTRDKMREMISRGCWDEKLVEVRCHQVGDPVMESFSEPNGRHGANFGNRQHLRRQKKRKKVTVKQARGDPACRGDGQARGHGTGFDLAQLWRAWNHLHRRDRQDRLTRGQGRNRRSARGAQRTSFPSWKGRRWTTKHGIVDTRHILFIAAGASH